MSKTWWDRRATELIERVTGHIVPRNGMMAPNWMLDDYEKLYADVKRYLAALSKEYGKRRQAPPSAVSLETTQ